MSKGKIINYQAICPFYIKETALKISCESAISDVFFQLYFANSVKKKEYQKKFCNTFNYADCPYARTLLQKECNKSESKRI